MVLNYTTALYTLIRVILSTLILILIWKWVFSYWDKRKMPNIKPHQISRYKCIGLSCKYIYDRFKSEGHKHGGIYFFTSPKYVVVDPEYVKNVLQQDVLKFSDKWFYSNKRDDPLSVNLFSVGGKEWKYLRGKLSPAFTTAKLRSMLDIVTNCGFKMIDMLDKKCNECCEIDVKLIMECYTIDVICSSAFGIDCNTCNNPGSEFRQYGRNIFEFSSYFRVFKTLFAFYLPDYARMCGVRLFDAESTNFFMNVLEEMVKIRKNNPTNRKDMLQLLLDLENSDNHEVKMKLLTSQVFIFFTAGFETSSIALTFCIFELVSNQPIQDKLRQEIRTVSEKNQGRITYDGITEMKYLNQIVEETLRKYPPISFILRECTDDYQVPGSDLLLEKGIGVVISILGLHHDPDYYPNPKLFDPDRFSVENKKTRVPFTYIPFGEGPRICIGLRFAIMIIKVALILLFKNFKLSLNEKTVLPLEYVRYSLTLLPKNEIYVNLEKL